MPNAFSYAQLEGLWLNAGGPPDQAPTAAAVAEAESSGVPTAENPTDNGGTQTSWGLWELSNGTHDPPVPNILDPAVNAQQAVIKYDASGWSPWGTYDSGAYQQYLNPNVAPDRNVATPKGGPVQTATTTAWWQWLNPVAWPGLIAGKAAGAAQQAAGQAFATVGKKIGHYVVEGVLVVAGVGLVVWGVGRATGAGRRIEPVIEQVKTAAPAAALAAA